MIYLDHHAATPLCREAAAAMDAARDIAWANPASTHAAGRASRRLLEDARRAVAEAIHGNPHDVVFTSGGTEACELGIRGLVRPGDRILTTAIEHPAVRACVSALPGILIDHLPVTAQSLPDASAFHGIGDRTFIILSWVNHETGTVLPIAEYAAVIEKEGARFFVDATQALGKLPIALRGIDALALASHKVGGPAGAGALWIRRGIDLDPVFRGGGQERGRRGGTPGVAALAGFGAACGAALSARLSAQGILAEKRDRLEAALVGQGAVVNAAELPRVGSVVNASVPGWRGDVLVAALDVEGLCVSSGAACSSGRNEPSPVLLALYPEEPWRAASALRFSIGFENTDREIEDAVEILCRVLRRANVGSS